MARAGGNTALARMWYDNPKQESTIRGFLDEGRARDRSSPTVNELVDEFWEKLDRAEQDLLILIIGRGEFVRRQQEGEGSECSP